MLYKIIAKTSNISYAQNNKTKKGNSVLDVQ